MVNLHIVLSFSIRDKYVTSLTILYLGVRWILRAVGSFTTPTVLIFLGKLRFLAVNLLASW
jgi:hypothetical protein